jgi:hypothetical protein
MCNFILEVFICHPANPVKIEKQLNLDRGFIACAARLLAAGAEKSRSFNPLVAQNEI